MKSNEHKKYGFWDKNTLNSIETQIIRKFILIVALILFIMWVLEILFFEVFYQNVRMRDLYSSVDKISLIYQEDDYAQKINDFAFKNNINIIIFDSTSNKINIECSTFGTLEDNFLIDKVLVALDKFNNSSQTSVVFENKEANTVIYLENFEINQNGYFIYVESIFTPLTSTNEVFIRLLLMASIIAFIIAMFFSYFLSKNISDPILNISKKAKLLTQGDFDIEFSSKEYQEVKQLSDTLNFAISEINKSQVLQKEVICNISHELKTPLTMIQSYAELINDISGDDKEKREEHLKIILEETKRLEYLVDDIMQYAKLESGLIEYDFKQFNLVDVLKKLEIFYKEKYLEKGYQISFNYDQDDVIINGDKNRIEQVLINFLNNAINYSQDKKVIKVSLTKLEDKFRLTIRDYGIGISKEDLEHIFDKHFRSIGAKRVSVGSGIGLSICKSILIEHKFYFGVKTKVGKGSIFYVDFPIIDEEK